MSKKVVNVLAKVFQALQEGKKSYREIAEENGVSKGTVFNIRKRLESSHIGVAEMDKLERSELLKVIYPKPGNKVEPDWEEVDEGLFVLEFLSPVQALEEAGWCCHVKPSRKSSGRKTGD